MKISYDLAALPERRRGLKESEEVTAIKAFLAGTQKNMCFEYDDEKEAKRRYDTVRNFRRQHKLQGKRMVHRCHKCSPRTDDTMIIYVLTQNVKVWLSRRHAKGTCRFVKNMIALEKLL